MNIYDTANKLAQELKQSEEYVKFKKAKEEIKNNLELKEKVEKFEKARYEVQTLALQGGKPFEDKTAEIQDMYIDLIKNETVKEYFELEIKFNIILSDINKIIGEAIKDVLS